MHKTIGILGGLSPESTVSYYQHITHTYVERFGDHGYPEIIMYSVGFQNYIDWGAAGKWDKIARDMIKVAHSLERAGAEFGVIATNTMHIVYDEMQAAIGIPFLHIVDAAAEAIRVRGYSTVGLLGTKFTMSQAFYRDRLVANGVDAIVPEEAEQDDIHRVIYEELVSGLIVDQSRRRFVEIIDNLKNRGAEGIVLGCTEIPLLVTDKDSPLPLFDTASIHAEKALQYAISGSA
jgi:aspartate racemase